MTAQEPSHRGVTVPRLVIVSFLSLVVAGCGSTPGPTITPAAGTLAGSPVASPVSTALPSRAPSSSPSPSVAPTFYSSTIGGMPVVEVPLDGARMTQVADTPGVQPGGPPTGPFLYRATYPRAHPASLFVADAGGGSERRVAIPTLASEGIEDTLVEDSWIVLLVSHRVGSIVPIPAAPCSGDEGEPIAWRILAAPLGIDGLPSAAWKVLDQGIARRAFRIPSAGEYCDGPLVPPIALAAGQVAYGVESPGAIRASTVLVRSVASGAIVRRYDVSNEVYQVTLSANAVAWSETTNELVDGRRPDWRLMTVPIASETPHVVSVGITAGPHHLFPPHLLLDGVAVVASLDLSGVWGTVVRVDGTHIQVLYAGTTRRDCEAAGVELGLVVLSCDDSGVGQAWIALWSASGGLRALGVPHRTGGGNAILLNDPWMLYTGYDVAQQQTWLVALPVSSLR